MIEANQRDLITLENSPLKTFKARVDEILTEKIHAEKLQRFEELKSAIESGRMSTDLGELKNYLIEIDEGIFGFVPDPEKL
jgi:anti-sigma28 factor (negative regulator of flagellin synthesis)